MQIGWLRDGIKKALDFFHVTRRPLNDRAVNGECGQEYRGRDMDGEFAVAGSDAAKLAA
jgi:hypothetical protein